MKQGARGLTRGSQVGANPLPIPHPTNLALFGHKITLYRFNQGAHTIAGAQIGARGLSPLAPLTLTTEFMNEADIVCKSVAYKPENTRQQSGVSHMGESFHRDTERKSW